MHQFRTWQTKGVEIELDPWPPESYGEGMTEFLLWEEEGVLAEAQT